MPTRPGDQLTLHDGTHVYDRRLGTHWSEARGVRVVQSHDTGSVLRFSPSRRQIDVYNERASAGAVDVRRVIRDLLFIPWLEGRGAIVVHGAAFVDSDERATLILGDRGAGKTTLFMSAAARGVKGGVACERIIVLPHPSGMKLYACPEAVSVFPGTLRSFDATADLAGPLSESDWSRASKVRVPWREMFARFGLSPMTGVALGRVVLPTWTRGAPEVRTIEADAAFHQIQAHVVTGRDVNRPDWLGWYEPRHTAATVAELAHYPTRGGTWSDVESACALLFDHWKGTEQ